MNRLMQLVLAFVIGIAIGAAPVLHAEKDSIRSMDLSQGLQAIHAQAIGAGLTFTQLRPFTALQKTENQAVQVQGTGTSPNYKVELLVTLDGTNYAKPELGGDVGTFTDSALHIIPLFGPVAVGHKLKFTELGGNALIVEASELSQ